MQRSAELSWLVAHGINSAIIIIGAILLTRGARLVIGRLQQRFGYGADRDHEWQRRASTLGGVLSRFATLGIWFVAILTLLRELSIDVLPVLTGAGIAGLAIGFGAQNLVRDVISGFFLVLEDQVRVGDIARINGVAGAIEEVNLRTIVLRDGEGAVYVFPNGTITQLANLSKQYSNALVDVRVPYTEDLERLFAAIRDAGHGMQQDAEWAPLLLAPIEIVGVESIADGAATVRARLKTQPLNQGAVANELRLRLLTLIAARGIRLHTTTAHGTTKP